MPASTGEGLNALRCGGELAVVAVQDKDVRHVGDAVVVVALMVSRALGIGSAGDCIVTCCARGCDGTAMMEVTEAVFANINEIFNLSHVELPIAKKWGLLCSSRQLQVDRRSLLWHACTTVIL
jgi:hypothetical protein